MLPQPRRLLPPPAARLLHPEREGRPRRRRRHHGPVGPRARLFKYGSGTGSNFSQLRGENEPLSGGGKSSGLMSPEDRRPRLPARSSPAAPPAARRQDGLPRPRPPGRRDVRQLEGPRGAEGRPRLAEGIKHLPKEQQDTASRLGLKLDYDFNGEAYYTVSGQNSNNSVRIPNAFFKRWSRTATGRSPTARAARSPRRSRPATCGTRSPTPPGDAPTRACSTTTRSTSGTPVRSRAASTRQTLRHRRHPRAHARRDLPRIDQMIHLPARVVTNLHARRRCTSSRSAFPTGTKDVFELRTAGGYALKLTADHKVWTAQPRLGRAQHLTSDDEVKLPSQPASVNEIGEPQDAKFFQLLGLFLSGANTRLDALRLDAPPQRHRRDRRLRPLRRRPVGPAALRRRLRQRRHGRRRADAAATMPKLRRPAARPTR